MFMTFKIGLKGHSTAHICTLTFIAKVHIGKTRNAQPTVSIKEGLSTCDLDPHVVDPESIGRGVDDSDTPICLIETESQTRGALGRKRLRSGNI